MAPPPSTVVPSSGPRSEPRIDLTHQTVNGYRVLHQLGSGGMADVYLAFHETLQRHVALKVMRPDLAASKDHIQRFLQEARSAASLIHPNIVQVYDIGNWERFHYIAQEYVAGNTLRTFIHRRGTLPQLEAMSILLQTAAALQKAATIGIVHRDIKPDNILLTPEGDVKVTDFGLARVRSQTQGLTEIGVALGTPTYMSPEQVQGQTVDARTDIYSLGATAFEMLAGRPPFEGETALALALQHVQNEPPDLRTLRPDLDEEFVGIIMRMLAKNINDRIVSAAELIRAIRRVAERLSLSVSLDQPIPLSGIFLDNVPLIGPQTTHLQTVALQNSQKAKRRFQFRQCLVPAGLVAVMVLTAFLSSHAGVRPLVTEPTLRSAQAIPMESEIEKQYFSALINNRPADWRAVELRHPIDKNKPLTISYNLKAWLQLAWLNLEHQNTVEAIEATDKILANARDDDEVIRILALVAKSICYLQRKDEPRFNQTMGQAKKEFQALSNEEKMLVEKLIPASAYNHWYHAQEAPPTDP